MQETKDVAATFKRQSDFDLGDLLLARDSRAWRMLLAGGRSKDPEGLSHGNRPYHRLSQILSAATGLGTQVEFPKLRLKFPNLTHV